MPITSPTRHTHADRKLMNSALFILRPECSKMATSAVHRTENKTNRVKSFCTVMQTACATLSLMSLYCHCYFCCHAYNCFCWLMFCSRISIIVVFTTSDKRVNLGGNSLLLFLGCSTSQKHAKMYLRDGFSQTIWHTETEIADQTHSLTQSLYTETGWPVLALTDPTAPRVWQYSL